MFPDAQARKVKLVTSVCLPSTDSVSLSLALMGGAGFAGLAACESTCGD